MAQRLATEVVKTSLQLTEAQMMNFIQLFSEQELLFQVKVLDNGSQEIVVRDDAHEIVLAFEYVAGLYICSGSCRLANLQLANLFRKALALFKGNAIIHRIYSGFTMIYTYNQGVVIKIVEMTQSEEKIVYERFDPLNNLEQLFHKQSAEEEINRIRIQINHLLDLRNSTNRQMSQDDIDNQLALLTHRLFVLEA